MPNCVTCNKPHKFRRYEGKCKTCYEEERAKEEHILVCKTCKSEFTVGYREKWKTVCVSCYCASLRQNAVCLI